MHWSIPKLKLYRAIIIYLWLNIIYRGDIAYGLHLFGQICTTQIATEISRTTYVLHYMLSPYNCKMTYNCNDKGTEYYLDECVRDREGGANEGGFQCIYFDREGLNISIVHILI